MELEAETFQKSPYTQMMEIAGESKFVGVLLIFNSYANEDHSKIDFLS